MTLSEKEVVETARFGFLNIEQDAKHDSVVIITQMKMCLGLLTIAGMPQSWLFEINGGESDGT